MPALSDYTAGTITLTNGSTDFTGSGTGWLAADFREGDTIFQVAGQTQWDAVIESIISNTAGTLAEPWGGATGTYGYRMRYMADGARVTAQARNLIELLGNGNLQALAGLTGPGVVVFNGPHAMIVKPETDFINGVFFNASVATFAGRAAYDGQPGPVDNTPGFTVLVNQDVNFDNRTTLYSKLSNTSGDWSTAAIITGPIGEMPTIVAGPTTTLSTGEPATFNVVPIADGYRLDAGIPRGNQGIPGNTGPAGEGLKVDASGPIADRGTYDAEAENFSYVADDEGLIYFRRTSTPGVWSEGVEFTAGPPGISGAAITTTPGVGDGTSGPYTLLAAPLNEDSVWVSISGVEQYNYSIVGTQITFGMNVPVGVPWQVKTSGPLPVGTGVSGPVSAVDNRIAVFDGTTGKLIKDGGVTIDEIQPTGVVKFDEAQSLTDPEKLQAANNIGAVSTEVQILTDPEKLQAANNIAAVSNVSDQSAQSFASAKKAILVKNVLQTWEQIGAEIALTLAVSTVDWIGLSAYRDLRLRGKFIANSADATLVARVGAGAFDGAGNYAYEGLSASGATISAAQVPGVTALMLSGPTGITVPGNFAASFDAEFFDFNKFALCRHISRGGSITQGGAYQMYFASGLHVAAQALDRLQVFASAGNVNAGSYFVLEGRRG